MICRFYIGKSAGAKSYDTAAKKYFREFANLNFPEFTAENAENTERKNYLREIIKRIWDLSATD
jgi:hypothetical protein